MNSDSSAPIVITAALDLRRKPSASSSVSSSSRCSSTTKSSQFKRSNLMAEGDLIDNSLPVDRAYTPATMSRTSIIVPQNEPPSGTVPSLPEASNLREFTSPTPSGDSSPPPAQLTSPFTTLTRPGDEDLFVKVPPLQETTGVKDQRTQFILPSPPLTRAGTKSTQKSTPSRPGSGPRESQNVEEGEEIDVTDARSWQNAQADVPNSSLSPEGCLEEEGVGSSHRITAIHPLKLEIPSNSHSPPLWETIVPPEDNGALRRTTNDTYVAQRYAPCPSTQLSALIRSQP